MHLDKSSATERIDGLAALIDAIAAYRADPENNVEESVYEHRGIQFFSIDPPMSPYFRR